jgi:DNA-binding SARP family transcriptional activator/tetratricopeptide (TPR) repeat protein
MSTTTTLDTLRGELVRSVAVHWTLGWALCNDAVSAAEQARGITGAGSHFLRKLSRSGAWGPTMAMFQILGPVRLFARGRNADLGSSAKVRGLLGILLLYADSAVPVDTIVDRLWDASDEIENGRQPPENPRKTLQSYVSKLRLRLKNASVPAHIRTEHGSYRIEVDPSLVDIHRFRQLTDEGRAAARRSDHVGAITAFQAAVDLWHGRPLADIQSSWSTRYGDDLVEHDLLPAHRGLLEAHAALGHHDEILARLRPLLMTHETNDDLIGLRMRALAVVDGIASVVTCFRDYTQKLRDMVDTEPGEDLVRLYRELTRSSATPSAGATADRRQPPQQLPRDIRHFVGRSDILRQLDELLATPDGHPAVVSLDGSPGVGKTALATHWVHHNHARFADGTLYADLGGFGPGTPISPATVVATFLEALGIARDDLPKDTAERESLLRRELIGRQILVVLDNARDSDHVGPLLAATSPSPVLITSRQKLSKLAYRDDAHCITVPTLLADEAIALLQLRIGYARVVDDLPAIHDLAALCSSTPLALRIAGEHVAARPDTPLSGLVQHLRSQHRLLDAGSHGDDESTKLRAVIGWSANALPPDAEQLFCLLGLHPSTRVSTQAATALAGWSIERTERAFDVLVGAHLAHQQGVDTYRVHDLLHSFAFDRAQSRFTPEERHQARHRQFDWYLATVSTAVSKVAPQRRPVPTLALETPIQPQKFDDDQQALHWCIRERSQVLAIAQSAIENQFHRHVWRLIATFDEIFNRFCDPREMVDIHRAALDSTRISASRFGEGCIQNNIGAITFYLGQYENAARSYTQALAIAREIDDEIGESACLFNIGTTLLERGIYGKAIEFYRQSLVIAERLDDKDGQAQVYHRLGEVHQRWERPAEAERFYHRSLAMRIQQNDTRNQAVTLAKLGDLCVDGDDPQKAIEYCERSLTISRDTYDHRKAAEALAIRGAAHYKLGAHVESAASAEEAAVLYHALSHARGEARALEILAQAQEAMGDTTAADKSRENALVLIEGLHDPIAARIRAALHPSERSVHGVPAQLTKSKSGTSPARR